ncbi:polysaccharide pyruvyl transferase family protein [Pedobacter immunditicola]|uniref:polysaccharide pyruvyl transferase family protein n=1 Tax=Pedobacter immunditicola TaxID=3133440 RepID=UPI0030A93590
MKKKIGIITFHRAINYGAILQVFALYKILKHMDYDVEVIDYRCASIEKKYKLFSFPFFFRRKNPIFLLKEAYSQLFTLNIRKSRRDKFDDFTKNFLKLTNSSYASPKHIPKNFDVYVAGSDQIWNFHITEGIDDAYFLNFIVEKASKKISYAASLEKKNFTDIMREKALVSKYLNFFNAVSVRESSLIPLIQPLTRNNVVNVLDPTLLLDKAVYTNMSIKPEVNEKYLLVFQLVSKPEVNQLAKHIAEMNDLKIVEIYSDIKPFRWGEENVKQTLSPQAFLGYFEHASFIVTTSFHGTSFSLIFQKQFFVVSSGVDNRQKDLLLSLKLSNRLVTGLKDADLEQLIDYNKVDLTLDKFRTSSLKFLKDNIDS